MRLLEPDRHAVPDGVQRQRAEVSRHLHRRRHEFSGKPARSSRSRHRRAFRASVYFLLDDRRLLCRPLQQAQRHHRHEVLRNRSDGFSSSPVSRSKACRWNAPAFFSSARRPRFSARRNTDFLPELLPEQRLSWGNGIIELGTFVASILATMAAGFLADRYVGHEVSCLVSFCLDSRALAWRQVSEFRAFRPPIR